MTGSGPYASRTAGLAQLLQTGLIGRLETNECAPLRRHKLLRTKTKNKQFSIKLEIMRTMKLMIFKTYKFSMIEWAQKIKKINEKKIEIHSIKKNYKISINRS